MTITPTFILIQNSFIHQNTVNKCRNQPIIESVQIGGYCGLCAAESAHGLNPKRS